MAEFDVVDLTVRAGNLLSRYMAAVDDADPREAAEFFSDDGTFENPQARAEGRDAVRDAEGGRRGGRVARRQAPAFGHRAGWGVARLHSSS